MSRYEATRRAARIRGYMHNSDFKAMVRMGFLFLSKVQNAPADRLITAMAVCFIMVCRHFGIEPRVALDITDRIVRDAQDKYPVQLNGFKRFLKEEIKLEGL